MQSWKASTPKGENKKNKKSATAAVRFINRDDEVLNN